MSSKRGISASLWLASLCLGLLGCSTKSSDLAAVRGEFQIPRYAKVISYSASPSDSGWFGREGLKIAIVFQLTPQAYKEYVARMAANGQWNRLPISEAYLRRMASIESAKRSRINSYGNTGATLPPEGSVYNPTDKQMLNQFIKALPQQPEKGLYQVRTAGTNILHAPKSVMLKPDRDLPDFMLAMLDDGRHRIAIKVSTGY